MNGPAARIHCVARSNWAARLQAMTKEDGALLLLSGATRTLLGTDPDGLVDLGERPVRGRRAAIRVWGIASGP